MNVIRKARSECTDSTLALARRTGTHHASMRWQISFAATGDAVRAEVNIADFAIAERTQSALAATGWAEDSRVEHLRATAGLAVTTVVNAVALTGFAKCVKVAVSSTLGARERRVLNWRWSSLRLSSENHTADSRKKSWKVDDNGTSRHDGTTTTVIWARTSDSDVNLEMAVEDDETVRSRFVAECVIVTGPGMRR